ncbi:hypothetical protein ACFWJS_30340 [Streptomyces sp. NPDC127061]|uniref:hypothetical protein n=1 Tax=Streptomyces sp. NPDC127061 TaxID=3347122 RepID=UPI00364E9A66
MGPGTGEKDRSLLALFKAVDVLNSTTEPQEVARHALPVIDAATDLTFSLDESFDYHVYRLHQRLGRLIHGKDWSSGPLSLRHHQVAKGAAFSDAQARSGPLRTDIAGNHMFDTMLEPLRATSHEAGSTEEPSELPNLSDLLTAEQTLLSYVSSGENEPVTDADSDFRNELRSADLLINQTVFFPRRSRPRFTGEPRFPETEQFRSRLPPETVRISLFLCDVYATPGQVPELGLHMTSLTREGFTRSRRTSYGPGTPGGLLRIGDGRPTVWLHPVASTIAELRTRVVEEPLRRVVGREAEAMLDVALGHCLGTIEEELAEWRELGKTHLGEPIVRPLTPEGADRHTDWATSSATASPESDFCLLSFVCTFRPAPDPRDPAPFVHAVVGVELESPGAGPECRPIAWSISPREQRSGGTSRQTKVALTAKLGIVEPAFERTSDATAESFGVVGMGELHSDPEWRFRPVNGRPLVGDERISMVVRIPAGQLAQATLQVSATVRQRRMGLVPYRAELPKQVRQVSLR